MTTKNNLDYLNNRIDVKEEIIVAISRVVNKIGKDNKDDLKVILTTEYGIIEGNINDGKSFTYSEMLSTTIYGMSKEYLSSRTKEKNVVNNTSFLILQNVTIRPFSNPERIIEMELLHLFTDKITGFTFGNKHIKYSEN